MEQPFSSLPGRAALPLRDPMGGEKRAPWRPLTSLRCGLDAVFSQNAGDGAPGYRMAEIQQGAANSCIPCPVPKLGPFEIDHKSTA